MRDKYPEGYIPKIKFWMTQRKNATNSYDRAKANSKIAYFITRHTETFGPLNLNKLKIE